MDIAMTKLFGGFPVDFTQATTTPIRWKGMAGTAPLRTTIPAIGTCRFIRRTLHG
ncbi:fructosamine kinase family protein [Niabella defluvii]|nr:fructosamine kinase family protein [Niabella sp. I65]